jgi:hypothetical protein
MVASDWLCLETAPDGSRLNGPWSPQVFSNCEDPGHNVLTIGITPSTRWIKQDRIRRAARPPRTERLVAPRQGRATSVRTHLFSLKTPKGPKKKEPQSGFINWMEGEEDSGRQSLRRSQVDEICIIDDDEEELENYDGETNAQQASSSSTSTGRTSGFEDSHSWDMLVEALGDNGTLENTI